jgi:uncharacterized membrane protein YkvI
MARIFSLIFLIIGSIIGAGFASGKEIDLYFVQYGGISIILIILMPLIFYFIIFEFIKFAKRNNINTIAEFNSFIFGKKSKIINLLFFISYLIFSSLMIAGINSLNKNDSTIISLLSCVFCYFILNFKDLGIEKVNNFCVPVIIIFILNCLKNIKFANNFNILFNFSFNNTLNCLISYICFCFVNIIMAIGGIISSAKNYTLKEYKISCILSSIILSILTLIIYFIIYFSKDILVNSDMPLINLNFSFFSYIVLYFSIFTTFLSCESALFSYKKQDKYFNLFILLLSFLLSKFGFSNIINYGYKLIGLIAFVYFLIIFIIIYNRK